MPPGPLPPPPIPPPPYPPPPRRRPADASPLSIECSHGRGVRSGLSFQAPVKSGGGDHVWASSAGVVAAPNNRKTLSPNAPSVRIPCMTSLSRAAALTLLLASERLVGLRRVGVL